MTSPIDSPAEPLPPLPPSPRVPASRYRRRFSLGNDSASLRSDSTRSSPRVLPPSSYSLNFPFQAYPGNPDPGMAIPGLPGLAHRNPSVESMAIAVQRSYAALGLLDPNNSPTPNTLPRSGSLSDLHRPYAPFMADASNSSPRNSVYSKSAAANMIHSPSSPDLGQIPRASSSQTVFRAPFLSPASRPSTLWAPPTNTTASPTASSTALALPKSKPPLPSARLTAPLSETEKPWLKEREPRTRLAWWVTAACWFLGLAGAAALCYTGISDIKLRLLNEGSLCMVMDENWGGGLDTNKWARDVELGGFGNGQFEMTTTSDTNLYVQNGQLYILPTLSSLSIQDIMKDGTNYTLPGCTATQAITTSSGSTDGDNNGGGGNGTTTATSSRPTSTTSANSTTTGGNTTDIVLTPRQDPSGLTQNVSACTASTSSALGTVINPVMSARINTKGKVGIRYGRVEIKAKLPRGDWLWPAVWMLPENNTYGKWPLSGEIDILEARGNAPSYPAQGRNYVRSSLNYGLASELTPITTGNEQGASLTRQIFGWFSLKRSSFDKGFHTYAVEWDDRFMRFYVDSRVKTILQVDTQGKGGKGFWDRGGFPETAQNGSSAVVVKDPWVDGGPSAPFDQRFYLIIDLAVGGSSGWFPDNKGDKPWYDGSQTAMRDFARAQDTWYPTWPDNPDDRAFRIESIKMWSMEPVC